MLLCLLFLIADTRLYTLLCRSVYRSVGPSQIFLKLRGVIVLLLLHNLPRLDCRVFGLVLFNKGKVVVSLRIGSYSFKNSLAILYKRILSFFFMRGGLR